MALITTEGGADTESYVTVSEADSYLSDMYGDDLASTWDDLEEGSKEARLKFAALLMNTYSYRGSKACRDQRLEFPRWWRTDDEADWMQDDEDTYIDYSDIPSNAPTTPTEVKYAQIEIAYQVIHTIMQLDPLSFGDKEIKMFELGGSLGIEFFPDPSSKTKLSKARLSSLDLIYAYLGKWYRVFSGAVI